MKPSDALAKCALRQCAHTAKSPYAKKKKVSAQPPTTAKVAGSLSNLYQDEEETAYPPRRRHNSLEPEVLMCSLEHIRSVSAALILRPQVLKNYSIFIRCAYASPAAILNLTPSLDPGIPSGGLV
ncbi:hypothetical protein Trydic_g23405 [Trypoxylus dichotomus]